MSLKTNFGLLERFNDFILRKTFQKLKYIKAKKFTLIFIVKNKCELFIQYMCKIMRTFY